MYQDGVTISIPTWNHEVFLPRSVRSALESVRILRDGGIRAEVLVVDDASRDGSRSLLRQLEARYYGEGLRVHIQPSNGGVARARNTALLAARFRYILFLDADNELISANVPLFLQAIRDTRGAGVYGNLLVRNLAHPKSSQVYSNESFQNRIFIANYIDAFALFDRLQVLDVAGYASDWANMQDWELWTHLATNGRRIVFVPAALGYYFELPNSMLRSMKNGENQMARAQRIFDQTGFRNRLLTNSNHLRYHPEVGYL
jgi:glycosyltransferase involved in cell wall biosynthesis